MNCSVAHASESTNHLANDCEVTKTKIFNMTRFLRYIGASIGVFAIIFAAISLVTNMKLTDILEWIAKYFGATFTLGYCLLVGVAVWSLFRLHSTLSNNAHGLHFWHQVGMQAANGISTLALTFTLLGISLGIGSLSEQSLTPENVNNVISILTTQFSMAFMTTVIGLPTATAMRAWLSIIFVKRQSAQLNHASKLSTLEEIS